MAPLSLDLFQLALDSIAEGALITDVNRRTVYANAAFFTMTGFSWDEIRGQSCAFLQGPGSSAAEILMIKSALDAGERHLGRILNYRKDRSAFWNELSITPLRDEHGVVTHFVSVQRDVSYEVSLESTLQYSREVDSLTGLPNRFSTRAFLSAALAKSRRDDSAVAVGVGDVSRFRELNHDYGYSAGDTLLEEIGFRLRGVVGEGDLFGRISADEFAIVLTGMPQSSAKEIVDSVRARIDMILSEPIEIAPETWVRPSLTFGFAIAPFDVREADALLATADERRQRHQPHTPAHAAAGGPELVVGDAVTYRPAP